MSGRAACGRAVLVSLLVAATGCSSGPNEAAEAAAPAEAPLSVQEPGFESFDFTDAAAWRPLEGGGLELHAKANYAPPFRSPTALALLRGDLESFELTLEAQSTGRQYGHRDLCLVFGYQDPSHYYYVHLAPAPDAHAHNVFLVNGSARKALLPVQSSGMEWDDAWHTLRLVRDAEAGTAAVYVDGSTEPILQVQDATLRQGRTGVGSFDDTGRFRQIAVRE